MQFLQRSSLSCLASSWLWDSMHILWFDTNTMVTLNNSRRGRLDRDKSSHIYKKELEYEERKTQDIAMKRHEID